MKEFSKVTVILRGYTYEETKVVMEALLQTTVRSVEITLNTENSLDTIKKIAKEYGDRILVGAGTVKNIDDAKRAIEAGAKFILSPILLNKEVIDECKKNKVTSIVGAMTPSEIWTAYEQGADIVKVFPINSLGKTYVKDVKAPLGDVKIMAVGGVSSKNAKEFLENGSDYIGIGSSLFKKEDLDSRNLDGLVESIRELEQELQ